MTLRSLLRHPKLKKAMTFTLKVVVSTAAICYVVSKIDVEQTWQTLCGASLYSVFVAIVIFMASQVVSALRLNTLFARLPLILGQVMNVRLYWLGLFYNFFLPGGVGGDGYKIYYLNRYYRIRVRDLLKAVFNDRLSGLVVIFCYLTLFVSFCVDLQLPGQQYFFALIPLALLADYVFLRWTKKELAATFWSIVGYSVVAQGLQMLAVSVILRSLCADCDVQSYMFLFLVSSIASAVPVTLGGIGAREMAFVIGAQTLGTNTDVALSLSILFYVVSLAGALPGAVIVLKPSLIEWHGHKGSARYQVPEK